MSTLFISDLHLSEKSPELTQLFLSFLQNQARQADALYILGDLFEMWIGDDNATPYNQAIIAALKQLSQCIPVYFMAGNRDFMIGQQFAIASGCQLLPDPSLVTLYDEPTLLAHGDLLCTHDKAHVFFRRLMQKRWLQRVLLSLPLIWRYRIGYGLRSQSKQRNKRLSAVMMDVNSTSLQEIMQKYRVKQLIHGHTHLPSIHYFSLNNQLVKRVVLNDWDKHGNVLIYSPDHSMRLTTITGADEYL